MEFLIEKLDEEVEALTAAHNDGAENDELLTHISRIEGTLAELKEELGG